MGMTVAAGPVPAGVERSRAVPGEGTPGASPGGGRLEAAAQAGRAFEALVVGRLLESMFAGLDTGGPFGGGPAEATWRGFMVQEYGAAIAEAGTLGIGRMVAAEAARLYAMQGGAAQGGAAQGGAAQDGAGPGDAGPGGAS